MPSLVLAKTIENVILKNYGEYINLFEEFQSEFLIGLNRTYQGLENGHLVLYFAKKTHHTILRKKDYDLDFNLSFDRFWENQTHMENEPTTIIDISKNVFLPKETTRRKISELISQKVLNRKLKIIEWFPSEKYKKSYNEAMVKEITQIAKLVKYVSEKINLNVPHDDIEREFKNKFSFYWFHYLDAQLQYLKLWKKHFNDLEIILIALQVSILVASKVKKGDVSHAAIFSNDTKIISDIYSSDSVNVSVSSISEITGIPRATCIRKLNLMVKLKIINQDNLTRRYYITSDAFSLKLVSSQTTKNVVKVFSEFFSICIKTINFKSAS